MNYHPELSVLVVTHNKPELTAQLALSISLAADTPSGSELLVYCSGNPLGLKRGHVQNLIEAVIRETDGAKPFGRIVVIEDDKNLGVAVGVNSLISLAQGEYLCITNDDMISNVAGWFEPLRARLNDTFGGKVGLACARIINGGRPYSFTPTLEQMRSNIADFSAAYKSTLHEQVPFQEEETNQPWFLKKADLWRYDAQDPIVNQRKWVCEWTDPCGALWHADWSCYQKVRLAGDRLGVVPQSLFYHMDHATLRDKDKNEPDWTSVSRTRYFQMWGTFEKVVPNEQNKKYILEGEVLIPYVQP